MKEYVYKVIFKKRGRKQNAFLGEMFETEEEARRNGESKKLTGENVIVKKVLKEDF